MPRITLEICAGSVDDCVTAAAGGADRIELNSALAVGGLTPSLGTLIEARERIHLPIIAMVRPRSGGFCYSNAEFAAIQRDIDLLLGHGANGIAFGFLREDGAVDVERCRTVMAQAGSSQIVFHRAFDVVPDPFEALEQLIDLGIDRVLTSGQQPTALDGCQTIASLHENADGRIEILPGSGISQSTVVELLARTGCDQVHASLSGMHIDRSTLANPVVRFNAAALPSENRYTATDPEAVVTMRQILDAH